LRGQFFNGQLDYTIAHQLGRLDDHRNQEETSKFISQYHLSNRFVTAKFMTAVIKHPEKPLIEVYDLARKELADAVYSKARLGTEVEKTLEQQINGFIDSLMEIERSLEQGARDGFFKEAFTSEFEKARIMGSLTRLKQIISGFLSAAGDATPQQDSIPENQRKQLPGAVPDPAPRTGGSDDKS
jgi:hypothetical protein